MKLLSNKGFVATEPFDDKDIRGGTKTIGGAVKLETIAALNGMSRLKVVIDCPELDLRVGDYVHVQSRKGVSAYAKNRLQLGDISFIMVPTADVDIKEIA